MSEVVNVSKPGVAGAVPDMRDCIAAFYAAYRSRDLELLHAILDDRVEWFLAGPADHFDFYGTRHGKGAVIEVITRLMPCYFHVTDFEFDQTLIDGERVATRGRVRARQRDTGRSIRYGFAISCASNAASWFRCAASPIHSMSPNRWSAIRSTSIA